MPTWSEMLGDGAIGGEKTWFCATFHLRDVPLRCSTDREVEERRHDRF